jgi:hypothetical protein
VLRSVRLHLLLWHRRRGEPVGGTEELHRMKTACSSDPAVAERVLADEVLKL